MKKIYACLVLIFAVYITKSQNTFESVASGYWGSASTWTLVSGSDGDGIPDADDNVIIKTGHTIGLNQNPTFTKTLTIQSTGVLNGNSKRLGIKGDFNNYGIVKNTLELYIQGSGSKIYSPSTYTASGNWWIQASCTIQAGSIINKKGAIILQNSGVGVANYGSVTLKNINGINLNGRVVAQSLSNNNIWINASGSSLFVEYNISLLPSKFTCTATSNTVTYAGLSNAVINTTYDNLTLAGNRTYTLTQSLKTNNKLVLSLTSANSFILDGCTSITIGGDFVSSAKVNSLTDDDSLIFNGNNALQTISGTTSNTFACMVINKPNLTDEVKFTRTQTITKELKMIGGTCNSNSNNLILASNSDETACISSISTPTNVNFTGSMVIQKFIDELPASYYDLSSPVSNTTVNDWDNEIFISGIGPYDGIGGPAGVDGYAGDSSIFTMHTYNEVTNHFDSVTGSNTSLVVAKGYQLYFADDAGETTWYAKTIDSRGTPNFGDITLTGLTRTAGKGLGWHLVGNPYACAIDYDNTTKTRMTNNVYYTDGGNYTNYFTAFGHRILYPHQGFYVETQNTALLKELKFTESCKIDDHTTTFVRKKPVYDVKLTISSSVVPFSHENNIIFNNDATIGFDEGIDASYRKFPVAIAPAIYMKDNTLNHDMITNYLNTQLEEVTIPLAIFTPKAGMYYIDANVLNTADYNYVWIENTKSGDKFDLNNSVPVDAQAMHTNNDYVLRLSKTKKIQIIAEKAINTDLLIYTTENTLNLKSSTDKYLVTEVLVFDMAGKLILTKNNIELQVAQAEKIDITQLPSGIYVVRAMNEKGEILTKKIVK